MASIFDGVPDASPKSDPFAGVPDAFAGVPDAFAGVPDAFAGVPDAATEPPKPSLLSRIFGSPSQVVTPPPSGRAAVVAALPKEQSPPASDEEAADRLVAAASKPSAGPYHALGSQPPKRTDEQAADALAAPTPPYHALGSQGQPKPVMAEQKPIPDFNATVTPRTPAAPAEATRAVLPEIPNPTQAEFEAERLRREKAWFPVFKEEYRKAAEYGFKKGDKYPTNEAAIRAYRDAIGEPLPQPLDSIEQYADELLQERDAKKKGEIATRNAALAANSISRAEDAARADALAEAMKAHSADAVRAGFSADPSGVARYMASIGQPLKMPRSTPGQTAEEETGVSRGTTPLGTLGASLSDVYSSLTAATGWDYIASVLTGNSPSERRGEKILQSEQALEQKQEVDRIKAKQESGAKLTPTEDRTLEQSRFFAQLGAAVDAVKAHPGDATKAALTDLVENAPLYALTSLAGSAAADALGSVVKGTLAAKRLEAAIAAGQKAAAAEVRAQRMGQLGEVLVAPSKLRTLGIEVSRDIPANVAAGMIIDKGRGENYDVGSLMRDVVSSIAITTPIGLLKGLKNLKPGEHLSAAQFKNLQKVLVEADVADAPRILKMMPELSDAANDTKFVENGGRIELKRADRTMSYEDAVKAGYGEDFLKAVGAKPGEDVIIPGRTRGRTATLYGRGDANTLREEVTHSRQNILRESEPGTPEAALSKRIDKWAEDVRAENAALPPEQRVALPDDDMELFANAYEASRVQGKPVPGMERVRIPDDIFNDWGNIFNTEVRPTGGDRPAEAGLIRPIEAAPTEATPVPKAPAKPTLTPEAVDLLARVDEGWMPSEQLTTKFRDILADNGVKVPQGASATDLVKALRAKMEPVAAAGEGLPPSGAPTSVETARGLRAPLEPGAIEEPTFPAADEAAEQVARQRPVVQPEEPVTDVQRLARQARRELPQYQLRGPDYARREAFTTLVGEDRKAARAKLTAASFSPEDVTRQLRLVDKMVADYVKTGSVDEAIANDVLREQIVKPAPERVKATIHRMVRQGVTGDVVVTLKSQLHAAIQKMQMEALLKEAGAAKRDGLRLRRMLATAARKELPPEIRGKMNHAIATAMTEKDADFGLKRIADVLEEHETGLLRKELSDLMANTSPATMRPEFRDKWNRLFADVDRSAMSDRTRNRLESLADFVERKQAEAESPEKGEEGVEPIWKVIPKDRLEQLKRLSSTPISQMKREDVEDLLNTAKQIVQMNELKNNLINMRTARNYDEATASAVREVNAKNPGREPPKDGLWSYIKNVAGRESSSPEVNLITMGGKDGVLHDIAYKQIVTAQSERYRAEHQMRAVLDAVFKDEGMDEAKLIEWRNSKVRVRLPDGGQEITLTRPEIVDLYGSLSNPENYAAFTKNGIQLKGMKDPTPLTERNIKAILGHLTKAEKRIGDAMLTVYENARPILNKASVLNEGYEKFTRDNYYPRSPDRNAFDDDLRDLGGFVRGTALEDIGMTKGIEKHGKPFVLMDATERFNKHIRDIAAYSEMSVPIRNALRVVGNSEVKKAIAAKFGDGAVKDLKDYLDDVSGRSHRKLTDAERAVQGLTRNFAVGVLGAKPTTIFNNFFGAPVQLLADMDAKETKVFLKNMSTMSIPEMRRLYAEMASYDGYWEQRWTRDPHKLVVYGGRQHVEGIANSKVQAATRKFQDAVMRPIAVAEMPAGIQLYKTLIETTTRAEAIKGMEGFHGKGGFDPNAPDIVKQYAATEAMMRFRRTQNAIDDIDKSKFARALSRQPLAAPLFMFQSQIFKLRDMTMMAWDDLQSAGGRSASAAEKARFVKRMTIIAASASAIPTTASYVWRRFREGFKDKDERVEAKRWGPLATALFNLADVAHPAFGEAARLGAAKMLGKGFGGSKGGFILESLGGLFDVAAGAGEGDFEKMYKGAQKGLPLLGMPNSPLQIVEGLTNIMSEGDPLLPLQNERYLLKKKMGIDPETGKQRTPKEALIAKVPGFTGEDAARYMTLDRVISKIRDLPLETQKEVAKKLLTPKTQSK